MSNRHFVRDKVDWGKCIECRCIKAFYSSTSCFTCYMEWAADDWARFEAGEQENYMYAENVLEGECETDGCEETFLFDEDEDGTQWRCFECWARDLVEAKMRPEEDDEEESEDSAD